MIEAGAPANGLYDFKFALSNAPSGGSQVGTTTNQTTLGVTNGLFTTTLDFGAVFTGNPAWLAISVQSNGLGSYVALTPLQELTPTPYALFAEGANAGGLSGTIAAANIANGAITANQLAAGIGVWTQSGDNIFYNIGNVGVGINTPGSSLEVLGSGAGGGLAAAARALKVRSSSAFGAAISCDATTLTGGQDWDFFSTGGTADEGQGKLVFRCDSANTEPMTLTTNKVGIGTTDPVTTLQVSGTVTATAFSGDGADLTSVNAAALGGLSSAAFWNMAGNAGANPTNGAFLGTTDNNPLEIHVDGTRGLRIEPDSRGDGVPTLIGGYAGNAMLQPGSGGDFIGGGGFAGIPNLIYSNSSGVFIGAGSGNQVGPNVNDAVLGGGHGNIIQAPDSVMGGGYSNSVGPNAQFAFVGGGLVNSNVAYGGTIGGGAYNNSSGNTYGYSTVSGGLSNFTGSFATVGGGYGNLASGFGSFIGGGGFATDAANPFGPINYFGNTASGQASAIAGGIYNVASGPGSFIGGGGFDAANNGDDFVIGNKAAGGGDVVCGGADNSTEGLDSTVSGGYFNAANGDYSMVPGGNLNGAFGFCSFAAGCGATANDDGSFVWSDSTETTTQDTGPNQFVIRATGGFFFYTTTGDKGAQLNSGDTSWTSLSDRNSKKDIEPEDCQAVLNKLAQVPISRWHYNWEAETNTPHIGPMAQDFKHAFYPGRDDKGITTLEFDGVELAAIQGLNQKVEDQLKEKDAEIQDLKQSVADLKKIVQALAEKK